MTAFTSNTMTRTFALLFVAVVAACSGEPITVSATATPTTLLLGDPAVELKGTAGPAGETLAFRWTIAKKPDGSAAKIVDDTKVNATFTPDVAGSYELTFTAADPELRTGGGVASMFDSRASASTTVTFEARSPDATRLVFRTQPTDIVAGSPFAPAIAVELRNVRDEVVLTSTAPVTLSLADATESSFIGNVTVNAVNGVATFDPLSLGTAGTDYRLDASAAGLEGARSEAFDVVAGAPDKDHSSISCAPETVVAGSSVTCTVHVNDMYGNPVPGVDATVTSSGTNTTIEPSGTVATGPNGEATVTVTPNTTGTEVVTGTVGGWTVDTTIEVTPGGVDSTKSTLIVSPPTAIADGSSTILVVVHARDANGNAVPGVEVTMTATGSANAFTPAVPQQTDATGAAAFSLVSTKAEEKTVTAALGGFTLTGTATFLAGPISLDESTMKVEPEKAVVGGEEKLTVTLTLVDAFGNPIAGQQVTFGSEATEDEFSTTDPLATDEDGVATVEVTSTLAGTRPASAMFADEQKLTADMVFTAGTPDPRTSTIEIRPATVLADGQAEASIRVTLRDAFGNPVPDTEVGLSLGVLRDVPVPASGRTNADGRFDAVLTSLKAGLKEVTAGWGGESTISATVTFFAGQPDKTQSTLTASPTSLVADGVAKTTLTATIRDANGNPVPSTLVTFDLSGTGNTLSATEATTDANGVASIDASSVHAEAKTARVLVPLAWDISTDVTFVPGTPDVRHCTFTATPAALAANNTDTSALSLTVRDAQDNVVPGLAVTFSATGTGNTLAPTSGTTNASGTVTSSIKSSVAETKSVTAAFAGKTMNQTIIFAAGVADPSKSTLVANPTSVVANGTATTTLTLTLKDATNNPVANQAVVFNSTGTANGFSINGPTNASGVTTVTMNSTKAEAKTITASFAGGSKTVNVTFVAGPPVLARSTFAGSPTTVVANNTAISTLTATLRDANSNACSGITVNVAVTGKGNKLNGAAPPTPPTVANVNVTTNASGVGTVTVASDKAETKVATATFGSPTQTFPTVSLSFVPGPADATQSTFTASPTTLVADNVTTSTFNLVVRDALGNVIPSVAVSVPLMTRGSTVMTVTGSTDAQGVFSGAVKSNLDGTHTLYANFASLQKLLTLEFTPAPPEIIEFVAPATMSSCATITYKIKQLQSKPVDVAFFFSRGPGLRGRAMTRHTTLPDGLTGLTSSPTGTAHTFVWNTTTDVPREDLSTLVLTATPTIPSVVTGPSVQVTGQVVQNALRFGAATNIAVGTQPHGMASGDFNADGRADLVVVVQGLNKVAVHLNNGTGGFSTGTQYATGTTPYNVAVADLNRDGKPDFVVTNQVSSTVSTYLNSGTGTFTGPTNYATGGTPISLAIGDLNRDGIPDIATANNNGANQHVAVLIGTGSSFAPFVALNTGSNNTTSIALGDVDNDGDLDIYTGVHTSNQVVVLRNAGNGTFSGLYGAPTGGSVPRSLVVEDFNLDGKVDVLVANQLSNNLTYMPHTAVGNPLQDGVPALTLSQPFAMATGDFDNDGKMDVAVSGAGNGTANILLGDASATGFEAPRAVATTGGAPYGLVAADFNADGRVDVATANYNAGNMTVALNTTAYRCDPGFAPAVAYTTATPRGAVAQTDFDGDGNLDLITTGTDAKVHVNWGVGDGTFTAVNSFSLTGSSVLVPSALATGDVDRDGKQDVVLVSGNTFGVTVKYTSRTATTATPSYNVALDMPAYSVRLDDMNRDGFLDMVVGRNQATPTTGITTPTHLWGSASGFGTPQTHGVQQYGPKPRLTTVDWNLDGLIDIAGSGHFGFIARRVTDTSYNTVHNTDAQVFIDVAHADFNRDGWPDLVMASENDGLIARARLFLNNKAGGVTPTNIGTNARPTSMAVSDVDADGIPDILQPTISGDLVVMFMNGSNGIRQTSTFPMGTTAPGNIVVGDYNRDGKPDVAVTEPATGNLRVMLGR